MKKIYTIIYEINGKREEFKCSFYSIKMCINKFIEQGGEIIEIISNTTKIETNVNKEDYYNKVCSKYYRDYKKGIITRKNYYDAIDNVKILIKKFDDVKEIDHKFKKIEKENKYFLL